MKYIPRAVLETGATCAHVTALRYFYVPDEAFSVRQSKLSGTRILFRPLNKHRGRIFYIFLSGKRKDVIKNAITEILQKECEFYPNTRQLVESILSLKAKAVACVSIRCRIKSAELPSGNHGVN